MELYLGRPFFSDTRGNEMNNTNITATPTPTLDRNWNEETQPDLPNVTNETAQLIAKTKQKWTVEQYKDLMWSYYYATETNMRAPKTIGTYNTWRQRNPDIYLDMNPNKLNTQRRNIEFKRWLANTELTDIKNQVLRHIQQQSQPEPDQDNAIENHIQHTDLLDTLDNADLQRNTPENIAEDGTLGAALMEAEFTDNEQEVQEMLTSIHQKLIEVEGIPVTNRKRLKRVRQNKNLSMKLKLVNKALTTFTTLKALNITEINNLMYAAASIIAGEVIEKPRYEKQEPQWKRRLQEKIDQHRKALSIFSELKKGVASRHVHSYINQSLRSVQKSYRDVEEHVQDIKMKLQARAQRLRRYEDRQQQFVQNSLFRDDTKKFYRQLHECKDNINKPPSQVQVENFWRGILEDPVEHNSNAAWIKEEQEIHRQVTVQDWTELTVTDVVKVIKKTHNWKAPGPDKLQNFWIKSFSSLHLELTRAVNDLLRDPQITPEWLTTGSTFLLYKGKDSSDPKNYRPITCLPTMYKLLTAAVSEKLYDHLITNRILPEEQKGCKKGSRGCKDQLLISKMVMEDAKKRKKNLCMAWIDYKKAFDSVPHSWILETLRIYQISPTIINFISTSMKGWNTEMQLFHQNGNIKTDKIRIKRGIFQGDSLSPLLFCVALIPFSNMIKKQKIGYTMDNNNTVSHLLYMDDLKIFGKNEEELRQATHIVKTLSDDIQMEFGLDKCASVIFRNGRRTSSQNIPLDEDQFIKNLEQEEAYKYLGVDEGNGTQHNIMKEKIAQEYYRRVRLVLRSKLNAKNKISAINSLAIPVPTYSFGIINWTTTEIEKMDRKTRKLLTMHGMHHPKADADRLYMKRRNGGRGLIELESAFNTTIVDLSNYIDRSEDKLMKMVKNHDISKRKYSLAKTSRETCTRYNVDEQQSQIKTLKVNIEKKRIQRVKEKPLHGQFLKHLSEPFIDTETSLAWLQNPALKGETESLIIAAQDQALNTRYHQKRILHHQVDSKCRMCGEAEETVTHIISSCSTLAATDYMDRHNKVANYVHWAISKKLGVTVSDQWYQHKPQPVINTDEYTIMWDKGVNTDLTINANRPDIIVHNKADKMCLLIDISVPADHNVRRKENEKISKYTGLSIDISRSWKTKTKTIPVVIGALGSVSKGLQKYLNQIPGTPSAFEIQKIALCGTAHILRRTLQ